MDFSAVIFILVIALAIGLVIGYKEVVQDFKLAFSRSGRELIALNNQDKHFWFSLAIGSGTIVLWKVLSLWLPLQADMIPFWGMGAIIGMETLLINWYREMRKQTKNGKYPNGEWVVEFDWRDVRFGLYGGMLAGLVLGGVLDIIKLFT